ncbi:MAG: F0F1 ATP synthase subunit A [bacterium]|nr:F0F1 ATP synthase subunit A [bacterium]
MLAVDTIPYFAITTESAHAPTESSAPELQNIITLLYQQWKDIPFIGILHHWENIVFSILIAFCLIIVAYLATRKQELIPNKLQNFVELIVSGLNDFILGILGERGKQYVPFLGTLFLYIVCMNLAGLIPLMKSSTSSINTTAALAIVVFFYVQYIGIKERGLIRYLDHLAGEPRNIVTILLVPLMLPLHIITELIKPVSLSLRLFGNIMGEDVLIAVFLGLGIFILGFLKIPVGIPLHFPFLLLAMLTSLVQAVVFSLLSTVYILMMLPHHE